MLEDEQVEFGTFQVEDIVSGMEQRQNSRDRSEVGNVGGRNENVPVLPSRAEMGKNNQESRCEQLSYILHFNQTMPSAIPPPWDMFSIFWVLPFPFALHEMPFPPL